MKKLLLLLLVVLLAEALARTETEKPLRVALHAQSRYDEHGWVAGSEITTAGIMRALRRHPLFGDVRIFAPFSYGGLLEKKEEEEEEEEEFDVAIVEGYTGSVPAFIERLRSLNPDVIVLHYCLDTYPTLEDHILRLDVDGFLTNSIKLLPTLQKLAPSFFMMLATDPHVMNTKVEPKYSDKSHTVVYLGHNSEGKDMLHTMLAEAAPFGLAIYGHNWHNAPPALRKHYRGVLPLGDVAKLFSSAKVVLGTTDRVQMELGMINNRVFDALSCGAAFVSDSFPALRKHFPHNTVSFVSPGTPGQTSAAIRAILARNSSHRQQMAAKVRQHIVNEHSWDRRLQTIVDAIEAVRSQRQRGERRNNLRRLAIISSSPGNIAGLEKFNVQVYNSNITLTQENVQQMASADFVIVMDASITTTLHSKVLGRAFESIETVNDMGWRAKKVLFWNDHWDSIEENFYDAIVCPEAAPQWLRNAHGRIIEHSIIEIQKCSDTVSLAVRVTLRNFAPNRDGMWCLRVDGIEQQ
eukprot:g3945.t1